MKDINGYPMAEKGEILDEELRHIIEDGELIEMNPDNFLAVTPRPRWWGADFKSFREKIDRIKGRIDDKKPIDPLWIRVFYKKISHEGRHRAFAAREAGLDVVPVFVHKSSPTKKELEQLGIRG